MPDCGKVIDALQNAVVEGGVVKMSTEFRDIIVEILREQPQWISVKDKLPDDASDVLAYYDDGTESRIIPANYYKQCWYDCVFNRAIDGLETGFIKYWMSLPKAPEVKQNETD